MCLAAVETSNHIDSLRVWTSYNIPGIKSQVEKVRQQRVTLFFIGLATGTILLFLVSSWANRDQKKESKLLAELCDMRSAEIRYIFSENMEIFHAKHRDSNFPPTQIWLRFFRDFQLEYPSQSDKIFLTIVLSVYTKYLTRHIIVS
jgi:hypothetical protein